MYTSGILISFGVALVLVGGFLFWYSLSPGIAPFLNLQRMLDNWRSLLTRGPANANLLYTDELGYRVEIQPDTQDQSRSSTNHRGYYPTATGFVLGNASRVHVMPDFIARLGFEDHWHEESRFLDNSAFCLREGVGADSAEFLCRGVRCQLVFAPESGLRSSDGYPMHCRLAVHLHVDLPLSEESALSTLFDGLPQGGLRNFLPLLKERVLGRLRSHLTKREYRQAMYEVPEIIEALNRDIWSGEPDQADDPFVALKGSIQIEFSGLNLAPREEAERNFLDHVQRGQEEIAEKILKKERNLESRVMNLESQWRKLSDNTLPTLERKKIEKEQEGTTETFIYSPPQAIKRLQVRVPQTIQAMKEMIEATAIKRQQYNDIIANVEALYDSAREELKNDCAQITSLYQELHGFIVDLEALNKQIMENPDQVTEE